MVFARFYPPVASGPLADTMLTVANFGFLNHLYSVDGEVEQPNGPTPIQAGTQQFNADKDPITGTINIVHHISSDETQMIRSTNNGASWVPTTLFTNTQLSPVQPYAKVRAYNGVGLTNPSGNFNRLLRTTDDGASWAEITGVPQVSPIFNYNDFAYSPSLGRWIACGRGRQVIYSDDDGATWTIAPGSPPASGQTARQITCCAWNETFGQFIAVQQTVNAWTSPDGLTWTQRTIPPAGAIGNTTYDIAVNWNDGTTVVTTEANFGSRDPFIVSTDGGNTWTDVGANSIQGLSYKIVYNGTFFYAQSGGPTAPGGTDAAISADGTTWTTVTNANSPQQATIVSLVCPPPPPVPVGSDFIAFDTGSNTLTLDQNGLGGAIVGAGNSPFGTGNPINVASRPGLVLLGVLTNQGANDRYDFWSSPDAGVNWTQQSFSITGDNQSGALARMKYLGNNAVLPSVGSYVFTDDDGVTSSTVNLANVPLGSWNKLDRNPNTGVSIMVGAGFSVARSTDDGVSFTVVRQTGAFSSDRNVGVIYIDALGLWLVSEGANIISSSDDGLTWGAYSSGHGAGTLPTNFALNPNTGTLLFGGLLPNNTIRRSTDNGLTWGPSNIVGTSGNIQDVAWTGSVFIASINASPNRLLVSTDDGVTFNGVAVTGSNGPNRAVEPIL